MVVCSSKYYDEQISYFVNWIFKLEGFFFYSLKKKVSQLQDVKVMITIKRESWMWIFIYIKDEYNCK